MFPLDVFFFPPYKENKSNFHDVSFKTGQPVAFFFSKSPKVRDFLSNLKHKS